MSNDLSIIQQIQEDLEYSIEQIEGIVGNEDTNTDFNKLHMQLLYTHSIALNTIIELLTDKTKNDKAVE